MSERDRLLAAIRASPRDEGLRLVYADWLEEHGDEQDRRLAAFIRVQCQLEPLRDLPRDGDVVALHEEEEAALGKSRDRWLGRPFINTAWQHYEYASFAFRRGLLEQATLPAEAYLEVAEVLAERFPAFHDLRLFDLR